MKIILRRNDKTSIFCPPVCKRQTMVTMKTKGIELSIACTLLVVGLFIMIIAH